LDVLDVVDDITDVVEDTLCFVDDITDVVGDTLCFMDDITDVVDDTLCFVDDITDVVDDTLYFVGDVRNFVRESLRIVSEIAIGRESESWLSRRCSTDECRSGQMVGRRCRVAGEVWAAGHCRLSQSKIIPPNLCLKMPILHRTIRR